MTNTVANQVLILSIHIGAILRMEFSATACLPSCATEIAELGSASAGHPVTSAGPLNE